MINAVLSLATVLAVISMAWSPALARDGGSHGGGKQATTTQVNKPKPQLHITKHVDKASPKLYESLSKGTHIPSQ